MTVKSVDYQQLLDNCTDALRREKIQAVIDEGSQEAAARKLGINTRTLERVIKSERIKQSKAGIGEHYIAPTNIPASMSVKGTTTLYKEDGPVMQWVKTDVEKATHEQIVEQAIEKVYSMGIKRAKLINPPKHKDSDLLCDYTIGDAHIGMYAWAREAGDDFDTDIAINMLRKATQHLVASSPNAETAFILDVGDLFHADNQSNETSRSHNKLDTDTRWARVLELGIYCIRDLIDLALQKHHTVIYRSVIGNHNEHTAIMVNIAMQLHYENEPRVTIINNPSLFNYYRFGVNLLADTHGHTMKPQDLPLLMATDVPDLWAKTTTRIWRTGHVHHESKKEYNGCDVETMRTLAPKDSWHASEGYRSNRDMRCTIYHKKNGFVGRNVVNPSMLGY